MAAFIISRLDYCNIVYYGLPQVLLHRLQMAFNVAARLIYGEKKSCHITPLLESLYWLRVTERIEFKVCLIVYKALYEMAPRCLTELCTRDPALSERRPLRSQATSKNMLIEPNRANKTRFFERSFGVAGSVTWNRLPVTLREDQNITKFRLQMKSVLFERSFPRP